MTTDPSTAAAPPHDELVRFVFQADAARALAAPARALLAAAPRELAESFEQALRGAGAAP